MLVREINSETWTLGGADHLAADTAVDPLTDSFALDSAHETEIV
jgi:hypothetical protein